MMDPIQQQMMMHPANPQPANPQQLFPANQHQLFPTPSMQAPVVTTEPLESPVTMEPSGSIIPMTVKTTATDDVVTGEMTHEVARTAEGGKVLVRPTRLPVRSNRKGWPAASTATPIGWICSWNRPCAFT
jgi:hypothetical protein